MRNAPIFLNVQTVQTTLTTKKPPNPSSDSNSLSLKVGSADPCSLDPRPGSNIKDSRIHGIFAKEKSFKMIATYQRRSMFDLPHGQCLCSEGSIFRDSKWPSMPLTRMVVMPYPPLKFWDTVCFQLFNRIPD